MIDFTDPWTFVDNSMAILHVDMDAFYASIEERDRPELVGKPVIVGGNSEGRGVVAAANYVVRRFGVHSAMATRTALRLCPEAIVIPPDMAKYAAVSQQVQEVFGRFTPLVEPLSLDEAFLDVGGCEGLFGPPDEIARRVKAEIRAETGLVASVGVAPNKFLAKIASDLEKPDGLTVVDPDRVQEFLDPLPVGRVWGVGRVTGGALEEMGVHTIADLRRLDRAVLNDRFGKWGGRLWHLSRGIDDRAVVPDREAKSISHETTFPVDIESPELLRARLLALVEQVAYRLRRNGLVGRTVSIKVRFSTFRTVTRSSTLEEPASITSRLWDEAATLLSERLPDPLPAVRLLGMGVSGLERRGRQGELFGDATEEDRAIDTAVDGIRDRFGRLKLTRGTDLE